MSKEIWKTVIDYEGFYEVSNSGRVRSLNRVVKVDNRWGGKTKRFLKGCLLKQTPDTKGYPMVVLSKQGQRKYFRVHQLIMRHFIGAPPKNYEVRHLNGVRSDARLLNLTYGTRKENHADKRMHGTVCLGENNPQAKLTEFGVRVIRRLDRRVSGRALSKIFNVSPMTISRAKNKLSWGHI